MASDSKVNVGNIPYDLKIHIAPYPFDRPEDLLSVMEALGESGDSDIEVDENIFDDPNDLLDVAESSEEDE